MPEPQQPAAKPSGDYIYGIDLVRFACAVSVAAFHLTWMTPAIAWTLPFGWVGVEVFFVISGLVIANSAHGATARHFMVGRFLRIYPAAWCAAAVSYPLFLWGGYARHTTGLIQLYYSMILLPGPFLATAYWTLPIELAFYFVIYTVITFHGFKHIQAIAILLILWGAPYLIALALWSHAPAMHGSPHWAWIDFDYGWKNMSLLRHGPYFGLGILVWLMKEKRLSKLGACAAVLALALACLEIYARAVEVWPKFAQSPVAPQASWKHLAAPSSIAFLLAFAAILLSVRFNRLFPANTAVRRGARLLGLTTYPFYLLHERVGELCIFLANRAGLGPLASALLALAAVGAVALAIAWYFEPALRRLLKKLGSMQSPAAKNHALETP